MRTFSRRVGTLRFLVKNSLGMTNVRSRVDQEFAEVVKVGKVRAKYRRRLLQILHTSRALDSALNGFNTYHVVSCRKSLGGYLMGLTNHRSATLKGKLASAEKVRFQKEIVDLRNKYMHEAGAFPKDDKEILAFLAEMEFCLTTVLGLE